MKMDLLIRNAKLLDLDSGAETLADVGVRMGRIALVQPAGITTQEARRELDVSGAYLFPGFIDYHVHLFQHGSGFGMDANKLFTAGVTTAVDMGSSGYANYSAMYCSDIAGKAPRLKSFINLSPVGQPGKGINEPLNEEVISVEKMREQMIAHPGEIVGVKIRISRPIVGELGLQPLRRAVEVGEELGLPVCVHTTNPPESASAVAAILRPGDIYSHTYHGKGNTILNDDGSVQQGILDAQKRGVLMEVGNGKVNFNFSVAEKATAAGLWPDIISSDSTPATFHQSPAMWDLPFVMSKFLLLGMPLHKVVRAVTETPAHCLGLADRVGKIALGYDSDLTLCRMEEGTVHFEDSDGNHRTGECQLHVAATIRSGEIVFQNND